MVISKVITFKLFKVNELRDLIYDVANAGFRLKTTCYDFGIPVFENFHYFTPRDLQIYGEFRSFFLVAFDGDTIVGVIKFAFYPKGECFVSEPHFGINYIDVHRAYQGKGMATELIKEFYNHEHILKDEMVYISSLSDMGKKCSIDTLFKKFSTNNKVITYEESMAM